MGRYSRIFCRGRLWLCCTAALILISPPNPALYADRGRISPESRVYYVDSKTGSDQGSGTIDAPWKTLEKIHNRIFSPGDSVCFARGSVFQGGFIISSSGEPDNPITFTVGRIMFSLPGPVSATQRYEAIPEQQSAKSSIGF